jgi:hypothetical protein
VSGEIGLQVDQNRAALPSNFPPAILALNDILPPDLADIARPVASGFQVDNSNTVWEHCGFDP